MNEYQAKYKEYQRLMRRIKVIECDLEELVERASCLEEELMMEQRE